MKGLIGEGDREVLSTLCKSLGIFKLECDGVFDGVQALDMYSNNEYDFVLLDMSLPRINGLQVSKKIRETNKNIPIIIITSLCEIDEATLMLDSGADTYLYMPLVLSTVVNQINSVITQKKKNLTLEKDGLKLDSSTLTMSFDKEIKLVHQEWTTMKLLFETDEYIPFDTLLKKYPDIRLGRIEVYIESLNKKLELISSPLRIIYAQEKGFKLDRIHD